MGRQQGLKGKTPIPVIIVNFNGGELLTGCVTAVLASTCPVRVLVSDNGSRDDSLARLRAAHAGEPRLTIRENGANLGFAGGGNAVLAGARGPFLLFLNPDCIVGPETLAGMEAAMTARPDAGMAGCLVKNPDGTLHDSTVRRLPTPWRSAARVLHLHRLFPASPRFQGIAAPPPQPGAPPVEVEGVSGAFMFVRREALQDVGPLDERYFLHCEDLDWFYRFRQKGWKILLVPKAEVVHHIGFSSAARPVRVLWHKHRGMVRFYRRFFRERYPLPLMWLVLAVVWARFSLLAILALPRALRPAPPPARK